ncbi:transposable element Tcb1 transposase [Trichonephila clavipes]|nr:transposable element Tcb1 transposase [Trichonephila clavipes]
MSANFTFLLHFDSELKKYSQDCAIQDEKQRETFSGTWKRSRVRQRKDNEAYRDCGLSFGEIGSHIGRNQTNVLRICGRWMLQDTTDKRGRSHPPQCTTSHSARIIRRRLQQSGLSARRPLLGLPLTQNHRRIRRQWWEERRKWVAERNEVVFYEESRICLQHHDGRIRVWRQRGDKMLNSCIIHGHTGSERSIMGSSTSLPLPPIVRDDFWFEGYLECPHGAQALCLLRDSLMPHDTAVSFTNRSTGWDIVPLQTMKNLVEKMKEVPS